MKKKTLRKKLTIAALAVCILGSGSAFAALRIVAGPQPDGTAYTPSGWRVTPVGVQKPAGFYPANAVLSPDGQALLVPDIVGNHNGRQAMQVLDAKDGSLIQELELTASDEGVAPGLAFSHNGKHVYLAAANKNTVVVFGWDSGAKKLTIQQKLTMPNNTFPQNVAVAPDDKTVYVTGQYADTLVAVDVATGKTSTAPAGSYPYGLALSADGKTAYVSNQGENTLSVFSVDGRTIYPLSKITVGTHPNAVLPDAKRNRLFIANGDSDTLSVIDTLKNTVSNTISMAPYAGAPAGSSPTNMTLSPDGGTLYVTNSGNNDVAVVNVSDRDQFGLIKGFIPTGWYPTGVQAAPDGKLLVVSAKGLGTGSNKGKDNNHNLYIEQMLQGYLSVIPAPSSSQLKTYTRMVRENNGFDKNGKVSGFANHEEHDTIVPRSPGVGSPIKHIIYIVKENRTYDQVFGDLTDADGTPRGNGDPSLTLFGKDITPNQHKLALQFVTLDNFYADGEVSQDGWDWATEANSNPFNQLATHQGYGGNGATYDSSGWLDSQVTAGNKDPNRAFLWDAASAAGKTFRHYGMHSVPSDWFGPKNKVKCAPGKYCTYEPLLNENTDQDYPWFDMDIPDMKRFEEWNKEFQQYVANNNLPTFQFIDLPRDHTAGGATAKELVADNDMALGKIVDTVSRSKYWKDTAIFVVEDDAQDGADHVDAHRTIAQVISPYTQRGIVDSHFYSQVSMLRTMELLVGMGPLTQFDAAALPMIYSFGDEPNFSSFKAVTAPAVSMTASSAMAKPGETVTVTGTVKNTGDYPLSNAKLRLITPNGWKATTGEVPVTLEPGASKSTSWTVNVSDSAQPGQQQLTVQADYPIYKGLTGSKTASADLRVPDPNIIAQSKMTATATSQETVGDNNSASNVLDGDPSTMWHTKWNGSDALPQSITLKLGGTYDINKLYLVPRATNTNGIITAYNVYVSADGTSFNKVATGTWGSDNREKIAAFATAEAAYVKLEATEGIGGLASAAEINVAKGVPGAPAPKVEQPAAGTESVMKHEQMVGQPDQVDSRKLNEEIWRAIKGPNVPMPAPKHHVYNDNHDEENKKATFNW